MWKLVDVQIIYKKLCQQELVTSDCFFFVIRNSSGVQIFRNDEKARQRHLPKMYTLVVTMNWNRFRKIFRIRFCIFYNRSELSHCTLCISKFKKPLIQWKNSTHWRNVELTWKCSNSTVICISYASETSSALVNKLVEQVSQACLTSLARLVEPAWLV